MKDKIILQKMKKLFTPLTTVRQYKNMGCQNVVSKVRCMKSQCWKCCTCNCGCFSTQRLQYLSPKPKITLANHLLVLRKFTMKKVVWGVFVELRLFSVASLIWTSSSPDKMNRQTFFFVALSAQRRTDPMPWTIFCDSPEATISWIFRLHASQELLNAKMVVR